MASSAEFIEFVCSQLKDAGFIRTRKMFGDYCIYVNEKPMLLVCDEIVYIKKHEVLKELMNKAETGFPYPGSREHYILDIEHASEAVRVVRTLCPYVDFPKQKKKKKK